MTESHPSRRDVVHGGAAATLAALAAPALPAAAAAAAMVPEIATGTVYVNGDGSADQSRRGLGGVMVSNGRDVVLTDGDGRYRLPVEPGQVVFVVKPSGYVLPTDGHMLPRFHYVYQPAGSPPDLKLRYEGIAPTGKLPASIDFALERREEPSDFDVILFTDPQPESETEVRFIRDTVVDGVIGTKAAFGITAGDIMFDDLSMYPRYLRILAQIGLQWYNIGGNHDLNLEAPDRRYSRETFKRVFGPPYYAFEFGKTLFLMLDNVEYLGPDPTKPRGAGKYRGHIGENQRAFIANILAHTPKDRLVVLVLHIPLRTYSDPGQAHDNTVDAPALLRLLEGRPSVSFAGHTHTTEHHYLAAAADAPDNDLNGLREVADSSAGHHHHVLTAVSGSWWSGPFDRYGIAAADSRDGSPNGYHVLSVSHSRYTTRYRASREPASKQMRITLDWAHHGERPELLAEFPVGRLLGSPIDQDNVRATDVVVNVFDGGPKTMVQYQIGTRPPIQMTPTRRTDPFVEEVYARNEATKKPWVKPEISSHIWTARLPPDLAADTHLIRVTAIDEYGREHNDSLVLEIVGSGAP